MRGWGKALVVTQQNWMVQQEKGETTQKSIPTKTLCSLVNEYRMDVNVHVFTGVSRLVLMVPSNQSSLLESIDVPTRSRSLDLMLISLTLTSKRVRSSKKVRWAGRSLDFQFAVCARGFLVVRL